MSLKEFNDLISNAMNNYNRERSLVGESFEEIKNAIIKIMNNHPNDYPDEYESIGAGALNAAILCSYIAARQNGRAHDYARSSIHGQVDAIVNALEKFAGRENENQ